jgi:membrane-associated protease RseP (regulator of RpoE activity)
MSDGGPGRWPVTDPDASSGIRIGFLTIYAYTMRGLGWLDAVVDRDGVGTWLDLGIVTLLGLQLSGLVITGKSAWDAFGKRPTALNEPLNMVAIPGLNDFMPLAAAPAVAIALVTAMVVHEGGHAIAFRHEAIPINEWGVGFLGVLPLAAYVDPVDDALERAPLRARLRVYSIGVFHNLLVAIGAFAVHLIPLTASPTEAFMAYFGWAIVGGAAPTAATVAGLGWLTNLAFWLAFINLNLAVLNALPIWVLDGGHVLADSVQALAERSGRGLAAQYRGLLVHGTAVSALALVLLAVFGPWL